MILRVSQQEMAVPRGDGTKIKTFPLCLLFTLKVEAVCFYDMLLNLYQIILLYIPEDIVLHTCCNDNSHLTRSTTSY
jgi:hypothetical protein